MDPEPLRTHLAEASPTLWATLSELAGEWISPLLEELPIQSARAFPKSINDPIWGTIELLPWETLLLDSPLLQRLRGVRQLGMAHYVYPGASHCRLEHTLGVVEAADRMIRSLRRNAEHRREFGDDPDETIPPPTEFDIHSIRLAALLHDVGHGPFSHVSEMAIEQRFSAELNAAGRVLRASFAGVLKIAPSEILAVLIVMSEPLRSVFEHARFGAPCRPVAELAPAIAAHILGSRACLAATYLSGVVSGPLDADKLDYMARDSHHAGLPIGMGISRLISKLEVVTITPENAPNPELRSRAQTAPHRRFYEMGISLSGIGAYEQMIIGRVILYDRMYYHHKVRAAESMVRQLITLVEEECGASFGVRDFFHGVSDDTMIAILGNDVRSDLVKSGNHRAQAIARLLLTRKMYHRAFAFAPRFIDGVDGLPDQEKTDTVQLLWKNILDVLHEPEGTAVLAKRIYAKCKELGFCIPELSAKADSLSQEHVIVDLPLNRTVVWQGDIPTRTESGHVGHPNLYFDPEKWSQAYEQNKQGGFVFAPREFAALVALASDIVFYDEFQIKINEAARHVSKTVSLINPEWVRTAAAAGLCSAECLAALTENAPILVPIREEDVRVPASFLAYDPSFQRRIHDEFRDAIPLGLPASMQRAVLDSIEHLAYFLQVVEQGGTFVARQSLLEKDLQQCVRDILRAKGVQVSEGAEVGGGETDLVLPGPIVLENKVRDATADPMGAGANYPWQTRRYSIAMSTRVGIVLVAYKPSSEAAILPLPDRIKVITPDNAPETCAQIKVVVPWGHNVPSDAHAPR